MAEDISLPLSHPPPHSKAWKLPIIMCSCASDEETPDFIINRVCLHPQCQQKALYCSECISKNLHDQLHSNHIFKLKDFLEGCVKACQGFKEQGPGSPKAFTVEALKLYDDKENLLSKYKEEIDKEISKVNSTFDKVLEEITAIFNERRGKLVAYLNKVYEMCELSFNMFSSKLDEYKQNLEFLKNNSIPICQDELIKQFLPIKSSNEFQDCITKLKELKSRFDSVGEDSYFNLNLLSDTLQRYLEVCPSLKELPETKTKVYPLLESLELKQSIIGTQPKLTFENNDYFQEIFIEILQLLRPCCPEIPSDFKKVFAEFGPLINEAKKSPDFAVDVPNHYSPAVTAPYLHFFHFNTKDLYILRLPSNIQPVQSEGWCFEKVALNIDFLLPSNHTSISTHDGRLYINGGKTALDKMYEMHFEEKRLIPRKSMKQRRWDHAICLSRGFIYVFGGADKEENYKLTKKCERYDSGLDMWTEISSFTTEASDFSVCSFKDKFIYKFGGWNSVSYVNIIERYDVQFDHWTVINSYLKPLLGGFPECIQINERQIYVFGGFYVKGHDENFLLEIEENDQEEWALNNGLEKIKFPNKQIFPVRSQFKMPKNALVHNKVVYTIYKNKEQSCLLAFDGNRWMILNDNIYLNNAIRSESFIE